MRPGLHAHVPGTGRITRDLHTPGIDAKGSQPPLRAHLDAGRMLPSRPPVCAGPARASLHPSVRTRRQNRPAPDSHVHRRARQAGPNDQRHLRCRGEGRGADPRAQRRQWVSRPPLAGSRRLSMGARTPHGVRTRPRGTRPPITFTRGTALPPGSQGRTPARFTCPRAPQCLPVRLKRAPYTSYACARKL